MSSKVDKWGRFGFFFQEGKGFQEMEMKFLFLTELQKDPLRNVPTEIEIWSKGWF
jgi:hypothetical protein